MQRLADIITGAVFILLVFVLSLSYGGKKRDKPDDPKR